MIIKRIKFGRAPVIGFYKTKKALCTFINMEGLNNDSKDFISLKKASIAHIVTY